MSRTKLHPKGTLYASDAVIATQQVTEIIGAKLDQCQRDLA
jgi:hypothetical protein